VSCAVVAVLVGATLTLGVRATAAPPPVGQHPPPITRPNPLCLATSPVPAWFRTLLAHILGVRCGPPTTRPTTTVGTIATVTTVVVSPTTGPWDGRFTVRATVHDENGQPVTGLVTFVFGVPQIMVSYPLDVDGEVVVADTRLTSDPGPSVNPLTITARFDGGGGYKPSSAETTVVFQPA